MQADGISGNGLVQGPRHAGEPAGPKAVGDMEPRHGQLCGAKASPSKESWLPHTTGPPPRLAQAPWLLPATSRLPGLALHTP